MIINTAITTQVLQTLCSDFMEAIKGRAYKFGESSAQNAQIDQKITELAEFFTGFEADTTTLFLSDLQAAFSKENIIKILKEIREEESFDLEAALYNKLTELCQVYKIIDDGDRIIASIIELYFQLTSVGDPDLANRLFFHRLYKQGNAMMGMLVRLDARTEQILANQHSYEMQTNNSSSFFSDSESGTIVGSDDDMFTWELNSQQTRGLFASQEKRKKEVSELIRYWRNERLKYPGWYIAPVGKRETLLAYTRDEELLWNTNDLSIQEQLDFSYELIWRYETGMIIFNQYLQKNIYKIWKTYFEINDFSNRTNNEYWFYIGQALLRDYREDMNWEKWDEIFHILFDKHDILSNGKYELKWEFIKQLFFRMQITDVRDKLQQYKCPKDLYGIRLQKYGLMAECGLLHTAYLEIKQLIDDLNEAFSIVKEENTQEKVYIGSLISCAYDLFSLVIQGLHPFERTEELKESWKNQKIFEKFFDFEHEKYQWNNNLYNYCCKHNEIPFELNRTIRTKHWGSDGSEKVYSFYRVLDRMGIPLSVGLTRLLSHQEIEFTGVLLKIVPNLGCYMLLRTGNEKAVKTIITRKFCIERGFDRCRSLFDYVFDSLEKNLESIRVNRKRGNAYAHLLNNGLEILRRLVSVTSITQQRKLMTLMCKLIDSDVMQKIHVMDNWITQVLNVVDEKTKAQFLNETLMSSTKNRSNIKDEMSLDPFEVISSSSLSQKYYEDEVVEASIIDELIHRANESDENRVMIIPRLEKLYKWKQLSLKQTEQFRDLIWKKTNEETGLPDLKQYYGAAFLDWPLPEGVNIEELVRKYIMNPDWYVNLKNRDLSAVTMGSSRICDEIYCLNSLYPEFLSIEDKEELLRYFAEYWEEGEEQFKKNERKEFYREEFIDRYQSLEQMISSFKIDTLNSDLKQRLMKMLSDMEAYSINTLSSKASICVDISEATLLVDQIIDAFYSDDKNVIIDATNASEIILRKWPDNESTLQLLSEQIKLIRYGRQPGLNYFFITIRNLAYLGLLDLSKETMTMLNKALLECCQYTSYEKASDKSEAAIHDMIRLRRACASTASILNKNIKEYKDESCRSGIEKWKEICTGEVSKNEFVEVKRVWLH